MNVVSRGVRNAFRNTTRTISIVVILSLSIGLSLVMLIARQAVDAKIKTTLRSIGNTVNVAPSGFVSGSNANNALTTTQLAKVAKLAHVTSVTETLIDHLQTNGTTSNPTAQPGDTTGSQGGSSSSNATTSLTSSITLGSNGSGVILSGNGAAPKLPDNFSLPVSIVGANHPTDPSILGATSLKVIRGRAPSGSKDANEAMIGSALARKNKLKVGSTFTAYGKTLKVVGIFDSNTSSGNDYIVVSLATAERLANEKSVVTSATVTADSLSNLHSVTSAVKKTLGSSADVTSNLDQANQALAPLNSVKSISLYSLIGSVAAGAIIILLTMIMIVRERRREIGILKAIGGSNIRIMLQFMSEALTFTLLSAAIGLAIGIVGGNPVTSTLVSTSGSRNNTAMPSGSVAAHPIGNPALSGVKNIHAQVGWTIILYGLGAAIVIALVGSALASYFISKVRPAEVLRSE